MATYEYEPLFFFISMLFKWILYELLYDVDKDDQSFSFTCGGYGSNIFRRMIGDTFERTNPYFSSVLIEDTIDYGFERRSLSSNNNGVLIFVSPFTIILVRLHMWSVFTVAMQPNCHDQVKYSLVENLWVSLESSFIFNQFKNLHVIASLL